MIVTCVLPKPVHCNFLGTVPSYQDHLISLYLGLNCLVNAEEQMPTHGNEDFLIVQVPVLYGAAIEGSATCLCRIASKTLSEFKPRFSTAIDSFISTSLVVAGEINQFYSLFTLQFSLKLNSFPHS